MHQDAPSHCGRCTGWGPDDPGAADFKASQKREFQHADFSGFARLFDAFYRSFTFQHVYLKRKPIHTKISPVCHSTSNYMFPRHVESFLQAALPSAWFKLIFAKVGDFGLLTL